MRRGGLGFGDGGVVEHVDDLDDADAGKRATEIGVRAARESVDELDGARAAAVVLRNDRVDVGERGEEKRGDRRWRGGGNFGNEALVRNDARAARHRGDEADRVGAVGHRGTSLGDGFDAADLDAGTGRHGAGMLGSAVAGFSKKRDWLRGERTATLAACRHYPVD